MSPADAAEMLGDQSFNFAMLGGAALSRVAAVARHSCAYVLEFSDLAEAVDAVFDAAAHPVAQCPDDPPGWAHEDLQIELCGGEALIWNQGPRELHHLSRTATDVWRACSLSEDPEVVAGAIVGMQPTPIVLADVRRCINELRASGLLSVSARRPPMAV
jgi:hypothetical protein